MGWGIEQDTLLFACISKNLWLGTLRPCFCPSWLLDLKYFWRDPHAQDGVLANKFVFAMSFNAVKVFFVDVQLILS